MRNVRSSSVGLILFFCCPTSSCVCCLDLNQQNTDGEFTFEQAMGSPSESSFVDSASSDVGIDQNSVDQASSPDELVEDEDSFAKREGRQLLCLRLSVIAILMVAATAIVSLVSRVSRNAEREEMETQYEGLASKVTGTLCNSINL